MREHHKSQEKGSLGAPTDISNHFWNRRMALSELERPLRGRFRSETVTDLEATDLERPFLTAIPQRKNVCSGVTFVWRPWPLAKVNVLNLKTGC